MVVPEGVVIEGSLMGSADTEIHGRITGDISIEGRLFLGPKAIVSGNVKATPARSRATSRARSSVPKRYTSAPPAASMPISWPASE
jgi:hypothetical protein